MLDSKKILAVLKKGGLTYRETARECGITYGTILNIIHPGSDHRKYITLQVLKLLNWAKVPLIEILNDSEEAQEQKVLLDQYYEQKIEQKKKARDAANQDDIIVTVKPNNLTSVFDAIFFLLGYLVGECFKIQKEPVDSPAQEGQE